MSSSQVGFLAGSMTGWFHARDLSLRLVIGSSYLEMVLALIMCNLIDVYTFLVLSCLV